MKSMHRHLHRENRPRAFRIVMALCFGLSALSGSFHYVLAHSTPHVSGLCADGSGPCLDTDCHDTTHDTPDTDCVVCVSLGRSLSTEVTTASSSDTVVSSTPAPLAAGPIPFRTFRPTSPRAPPALV